MRVAVLAVNYGTDEIAVRFVRRLTETTGGCAASVELVLVDNTVRRDSEDRGTFFSRVWSVMPRTMCLGPTKNLGYFGGALYGLGEYLRLRGAPHWTIVCNVDITFGDAALWTILRSGDYAHDVGIVAPSIWSRRYLRDLNPMMVHRPRPVRMHFYKAAFRNYYVQNAYGISAAASHRLLHAASRMRALLRTPSTTPDGVRTDLGQPRQIYAPQGSCILFRNTYFQRGGTLGYASFLFGEELFVAETAREIGAQVVYDPRLRVWHDDHSSTGLFRSREMARHAYRSAAYIADTHFT